MYFGGVKEMFEDLFAHVACMSNFDGNPYDKLFVTIMPDSDNYNPGESPTSIRLFEAYFTVVFRPGEFL